MTNTLWVIVKKYSVPVLFFTLGLIMLIMGYTKNQDSMFILAGIMMLAAGAISILYSTGILTTKLVYVIGGLTGIAAVYALYISGMSVYNTEKYMEDRNHCKALAQQNLQDIRFVQRAYMAKHGKYIGDWAEFVDYVNNGTVPYIDARGTVPGKKIKAEEREYLYHDNRPIDNNMTEEEAYRLSKWKEGPRYNELFSGFIRDTIEVSLLKTKFKSKSYITNREKSRFYKFSADSLPYIPFTDSKVKWMLEVADSVKMGESTVPAIFVHGTIPFAQIQGTENIIMSFGVLTSNSTSGTWEE
ncbi:MAG: hypothetical protein JKY09_07585 [Crocinitomicaceae bacterium]|nr:hypothetical protein [Crocinitomicaceae bacterium]